MYKSLSLQYPPSQHIPCPNISRPIIPQSPMPPGRNIRRPISVVQELHPVHFSQCKLTTVGRWADPIPQCREPRAEYGLYLAMARFTHGPMPTGPKAALWPLSVRRLVRRGVVGGDLPPVGRWANPIPQCQEPRAEYGLYPGMARFTHGPILTGPKATLCPLSIKTSQKRGRGR